MSTADTDPKTAADPAASVAAADEVRVTPRPVREEQAWREIGHTDFAPGVRWALVIGFLTFITLVPLVQLLVPDAVFARLLGHQAGADEPAEGAAVLRATVLAISDPPQRDGVYDDFLMRLRVQVDDGSAVGVSASEVVLVVTAMRDSAVLPVAAVEPGATIQVVPKPWAEVEPDLAGINASELPGALDASVETWYAAAIAVEGARELPAGMDFMGAWVGRGGDLPADARVGLGAGMAQAWADADGLLGGFLAANGHLARRIKLYETGLDDNAVLSLALRPSVQSLMTRLGVGNEQAFVGRDGWLFYAPGVTALTGPGFLDAKQLARRARSGDGFSEPPQPDPRTAIIDFRDQLAARGVELVLLPTPVKPSIHPGQLSGRMSDATEPVRNRSFEAFIADLQAAGVRVFDPASILMQAAADGDGYLATDTHWRPAAMTAVAEALAAELAGDLPAVPSPGWQRGAAEFTQLGDIGTMLELPAGQSVVAAETARIQPVRDAQGRSWRADARADVLLLGDSFTNIYHLEGMGWGASAGFAEQLAVELDRPLDLLARNDAGAHASRQMLVDALTRDPLRLRGKRVVIWQFAERELAVGDWKLLALPDVQPAMEPDQPTLALGPALTEPAAAPAAFAAIAEAAEHRAVVGLDDWLFVTSELKHLGSAPFWGEHVDDPDMDPVRAIADLHNQLYDLGIDLVLAPVPPRAVIYPDKVFASVPVDDAGHPQRLDPTLQACYEALRAEGVDVLDLTDRFIAARADDAEQGPIMCEQDTHWSPRGVQLAAREVYDHVADLEWVEEAELTEVEAGEPQVIEYVGDLVDRVPDHPVTVSRATITPVSDAGEAPFADDSPVLVLADSHGLVFSSGGDMHAEAAGFAEHLAAEFVFPVDRMARRGSGSTVRTDLARRFLGDRSAADAKRVVVYVFAARFLTESRHWRLVPLTQP